MGTAPQEDGAAIRRLVRSFLDDHTDPDDDVRGEDEPDENLPTVKVPDQVSPIG